MSGEYDFIFKGHHYTYKDSARNQLFCPHCGEAAPDGFFWSIGDKGYIGTRMPRNGDMAITCFECPNCFEKFFIHVPKSMAKRLIKRLKDTPTPDKQTSITTSNTRIGGE